MPIHDLLGDDEEVMLSPVRQAAIIPGTAIGLVFVAATIGVIVANSWQLGAFVRNVLIGLAIVLIVGRLVSWRRTTMVITTQRLLLAGGMNGAISMTQPIGSIRSVATRQTASERWLDYGDLFIDIDGGKTIVLNGFPYPLHLAEVLRTATGGVPKGG